MKDSRLAQMEERRRSRHELRAILANPKSTQEQIIQAKLILARRIADGTTAVREICVEYGLSEEQSFTLIANHRRIMGAFEEKAKNDVQDLEQSLKQLRAFPDPELPVA